MPRDVRLSGQDIRLVRPHMQEWQEALATVTPNRILTIRELKELIKIPYRELYHESITNSLIRYSLAQGELTRFGDRFIRLGKSRELTATFTNVVLNAGWDIEEFSPGSFYAYEDTYSVLDEDAIRAIHAFARRLNDTFRWMAVSTPVVQKHDPETTFTMDERTIKMISSRMDILNII